MPVVLWTALALAQLGLAVASSKCEQKCETKCATQCATKCDSECEAKCDAKCQSACPSKCASECESTRATTARRSTDTPTEAGWFELTLKGNFPISGPAGPHRCSPDFVHDMMPGPMHRPMPFAARFSMPHRMHHPMPHPPVGYLPPDFPCPMSALAPMPACELFEAFLNGPDGPPVVEASPLPIARSAGPPLPGQNPLVVGFHPWRRIMAAIRHLDSQCSRCECRPECCQNGKCLPCQCEGKQSTVEVGACPLGNCPLNASAGAACSMSSKCSQSARCSTLAAGCPIGGQCDPCRCENNCPCPISQPTDQPAGERMVLAFGARWCGLCQEMAPIVSRLQRQGLPICKVDVDQERELAQEYEVNSIPAFVLVVDGQPTRRMGGLPSEEDLREFVGTGRNGCSVPACAAQQRTVVYPAAGVPCTVTTATPAAAYPGASKVVQIVAATYPVPQPKAELLAKLLNEHCGVDANCSGGQIEVVTTAEKQQVVAQFISGVVQTAKTTASSTTRPIARKPYQSYPSKYDAYPSQCDAQPAAKYYPAPPNAACPTSTSPACAQQCEGDGVDMNVRATKGRIEIECRCADDAQPRRFRLVTDGDGVRLEEQCSDGSIQQTSGQRLEIRVNRKGLLGERLQRILRLGASEE